MQHTREYAQDWSILGSKAHQGRKVLWQNAGHWTSPKTSCMSTPLTCSLQVPTRTNEASRSESHLGPQECQAHKRLHSSKHFLKGLEQMLVCD